MARLRARWNKTGLDRSYRDLASVLAMNVWKLASESLLNLENEGFAIHTYQQRLDIILEFTAYAVHIVDRLAYDNLSAHNRQQLVVALAAKLMAILHDNSQDLSHQQVADHAAATQAAIETTKKRFAEVMDKRGEAYAQCRFDEDDQGPSFTLRKLLGDYVQEHIAIKADDKDRQWLPDYVLEQEAPAIYQGIYKTLDGLMAD